MPLLQELFYRRPSGCRKWPGSKFVDGVFRQLTQLPLDQSEGGDIVEGYKLDVPPGARILSDARQTGGFSDALTSVYSYMLLRTRDEDVSRQLTKLVFVQAWYFMGDPSAFRVFMAKTSHTVATRHLAHHHGEVEKSPHA